MYFKRINIIEWRQFELIDLDLSKRMTIITGANGSGKTTILGILAKHSGWHNPHISTPKKHSHGIRFFTRFYLGLDRSNDANVGSIEYDNGRLAQLQLGNSNSAEFELSIQHSLEISSLYIPSHRSIYRYQHVDSISTRKKNKETAFSEVSENTKNRYFSQAPYPNSFYMKNTLINWVVQGYGVADKDKIIMLRDEELVSNYEGFQRVLKRILPPSLGFKEIEIRNMEIVLVCNDGEDEFLLEAASGGISSLIDMAWQIYMFFTKEKQSCTVIIDEVENHLHPTLQRAILSNLMDAFPMAKFIVATHSPLIVNSVKESNIYVLAYNNRKKIVSKKLDFENEPKTATEILNEVLDVPVTLPIWVEESLNKLVNKYTHESISPERIKLFREELTTIGLGKYLPYTYDKLLEQKND